MLLHYDGDVLQNERDAVDLISTAHYEHGARWVVVPVDRLTDEFFQLRTGVAGAITQKFVTYRMGLAVLGDLADRTVAGTAFADFVREANRGRSVWFVADLDELHLRLAGPGERSAPHDARR